MIDREKTRLRADVLAADPEAPRYHFICPEGITGPFDPNGAVFWKGRYHLFYIFQRRRTGGGSVCCWGHASSADLLRWEYHPTALDPADGDPQTHIFSGGAFLDAEGRPALIYHGVGQGTCIAVPEDDGLIRWRNLPENPVIPEPKKDGDPGWGVYNVFDPHAWREGDSYYAILGGKVKPHDLYDTAYLFRSRDLVRWEYLHPFYNPNPRWTNEEDDCACPDFFRVGDRWVLMCISHWAGARYYVGRYERGTFVPEEHHPMNWPGGPCFATESLLDGRGRRIFWAWALSQQAADAPGADRYGVMTMPRVVSLDPRGRVSIEPPEEFASLRGACSSRAAFSLKAGDVEPLDGVRGAAAEIAVEVAPAAASVFGLKVRMSPDGAEETVIRVDAGRGTLAVDTTRSGRRRDLWRRYPICGVYNAKAEPRDVPVQEAPFVPDPGEPLRLRVFLDGSIVEVYANGRQCLTQRVYPARPDSLGAAVFCSAGAVEVRSAESWPLAL